jgi:hypothetical protein
VYDEELRVPAFLQAGTRALDHAQRTALELQHSRRIFASDLHATLLDLLGVFDASASLPYGAQTFGRSVLRPFPAAQPAFLLSNVTSLFWMDQQAFGVMQGDQKVVGSPSRPWVCFDTLVDPGEAVPRPASNCGELLRIGSGAFPEVPSP